MARVFVYVVDRDFGFAPNPFHGILSLATCKPRIRSVAAIGDWVVGIGGSRLRRRGQCIFGMRVTEAISFDDYWSRAEYQAKKPVRNGSRVSLVGDNIYSRVSNQWLQLDSHHSKPDGTPNAANVESDTSTNRVLLSEDFRYFGSESQIIPHEIVARMQYKNGRNHRTFDMAAAEPLISWLVKFPRNRVLADPCDFEYAAARFEGQKNRVI